MTLDEPYILGSATPPGEPRWMWTSMSPGKHGLASSSHCFCLQQGRIWSGAFVDFFDLAVAHARTAPDR